MRPLIPALAGVLALSACADTDLFERLDVPPQPAAYEVGPEPQMVVELSRPPAEAKPFVEEIAARCWLDHVVAADAMIVDRSTGSIVMTGPDADLLLLDFVPGATPENFAHLRFRGPVMANETKAALMLEHLVRAQRTDEIACPALDAPGRSGPVIAG